MQAMSARLRALLPVLTVAAVVVFLGRIAFPQMQESAGMWQYALNLTFMGSLIFATGWLFATRNVGGVLAGIYAGLIVWMFVSILIPLAVDFALTRGDTFSSPSAKTAILGLVTGSLMLLPIVVLLALAGHAIGRRMRRSIRDLK
jgi:hypothetical protein